MTKAHTDKLTEYSESPGLARATSIQFSSLSRNSSKQRWKQKFFFFFPNIETIIIYLS